MTTTILPAAGVAPLFTQQGVGTSPGYAALDDRRAHSGVLQEGVYGTSTLVTAGGISNVGQADFMVTQRGSGANMSVDINMPAAGFAYVQGDTLSGQGLYCVPVHSTNINELIAAADATNPRVDQVILEVQDNVLDASGGNQARTRVLTGTPTGGASLTNRSGALALPGSALLLADVLVPSSSASVPNANIRDRRKWARGAYLDVLGPNSGNATTGSSTFSDPSKIGYRLEFSGHPLSVVVSGHVGHSLTNGITSVGITLDSTVQGGSCVVTCPQPSTQTFFCFQRPLAPSPGSHVIALWFANSSGSGTATLYDSGGQVASMNAQEGPVNTFNATVTSG